MKDSNSADWKLPGNAESFIILIVVSFAEDMMGKLNEPDSIGSVPMVVEPTMLLENMFVYVCLAFGVTSTLKLAVSSKNKVPPLRKCLWYPDGLLF